MKVAPTSTWIAELELGDSFVPVGVCRARRPGDRAVRILVRLHGQVLGFVTVPLTIEADGGAVMSAIDDALGSSLADHLRRDGLDRARLGAHDVDAVESCSSRTRSCRTQLISVVVSTRDRPDILRTCLSRLQQLRYPNFEVVVVDNAPTTTGTRASFASVVGSDRRFRYVLEPVAGLSRARNRGLRETSAAHVAFTDDDVQVDPWWLDGIAAGFARDPRAGCVTGLVPPAELEHPAQHYFDRRYSWATGLEPRVYDLRSGGALSPLYPYSAGIFGTGANFAVDRALMVQLGGFDEALGAGSRARGGEDLDAFVRVLQAGRSLVYEPSAVVWHFHRASAASLRRQIYSYGVGLSAFLTKHASDPRTRRDVFRRVPHGARRITQLWTRAEIAGPAPPSLVAAEALGMLVGPQAYVRGRRRSRDAAAGA